MDSFGYIYRTTNLINGKLYIGQKLGIVDPDYLGSGTLIIRAVHKYGRENFKLDIIAFCNNRKILDNLEIKEISRHRNIYGKHFLYNIVDGGHGWTGGKHSVKTKKILREKALEQFSNPEMRKLFSDIAKNRIKHPMLGKHLSKQTKLKIGNANRGQNLKLRGVPKSEAHKEKLRQKALGRGHTLETRKKMSRSHTGLKRSPEECLAIKKRVTAWWKQKRLQKIMVL